MNALCGKTQATLYMTVPRTDEVNALCGKNPGYFVHDCSQDR